MQNQSQLVENIVKMRQQIPADFPKGLNRLVVNMDNQCKLSTPFHSQHWCTNTWHSPDGIPKPRDTISKPFVYLKL